MSVASDTSVTPATTPIPSPQSVLGDVAHNSIYANNLLYAVSDTTFQAMCDIYPWNIEEVKNLTDSSTNDDRRTALCAVLTQYLDKPPKNIWVYEAASGSDGFSALSDQDILTLCGVLAYLFSTNNAYFNDYTTGVRRPLDAINAIISNSVIFLSGSPDNAELVDTIQSFTPTEALYLIVEQYQSARAQLGFGALVPNPPTVLTDTALNNIFANSTAAALAKANAVTTLAKSISDAAGTFVKGMDDAANVGEDLSSALDVISKFSGVLGILGAGFSLLSAFTPSAESQDYKEIEHQLNVVTKKIDQLSQQLTKDTDQIKALITFDTTIKTKIGNVQTPLSDMQTYQTGFFQACRDRAFIDKKIALSGSGSTAWTPYDQPSNLQYKMVNQLANFIRNESNLINFGDKATDLWNAVVDSSGSPSPDNPPPSWENSPLYSGLVNNGASHADIVMTFQGTLQLAIQLKDMYYAYTFTDNIYGKTLDKYQITGSSSKPDMENAYSKIFPSSPTSETLNTYLSNLSNLEPLAGLDNIMDTCIEVLKHYHIPQDFTVVDISASAKLKVSAAKFAQGIPVSISAGVQPQWKEENYNVGGYDSSHSMTVVSFVDDNSEIMQLTQQGGAWAQASGDTSAASSIALNAQIAPAMVTPNTSNGDSAPPTRLPTAICANTGGNLGGSLKVFSEDGNGVLTDSSLTANAPAISMRSPEVFMQNNVLSGSYEYAYVDASNKIQVGIAGPVAMLGGPGGAINQVSNSEPYPWSSKPCLVNGSKLYCFYIDADGDLAFLQSDSSWTANSSVNELAGTGKPALTSRIEACSTFGGDELMVSYIDLNFNLVVVRLSLNDGAWSAKVEIPSATLGVLPAAAAVNAGPGLYNAGGTFEVMRLQTSKYNGGWPVQPNFGNGWRVVYRDNRNNIIRCSTNGTTNDTTGTYDWESAIISDSSHNGHSLLGAPCIAVNASMDSDIERTTSYNSGGNEYWHATTSMTSIITEHVFYMGASKNIIDSSYATTAKKEAQTS